MSILQGIAALNVYKQVALVRKSTDALTYEDEEGNLQTITDLGEAASSSVSSLFIALSTVSLSASIGDVSANVFHLLESITPTQAEAGDSHTAHRTG